MQANAHLWTEIRGRRRMADLLVATMAEAGAAVAFALPAESLNAIVDALRKQDRVRLVTVRHEGAGALMASAWAKLTGRLGVCMGTAGPGAANLLGGVYDATADGAPLLAVTGQVASHQLGTGSFQEIDAHALFSDAVVFNRLIASPEQTAVLPLACAHALHGRGAAHLSIAADVLASPVTRIPPPLRPAWLQARPVTVGERRHQAPAVSGGLGTALWRALDQALPTDAVVAVEPGVLLEAASLYLPPRDRTLTSSVQHGAHGYPLPAAIAATLAFPGRAAVAIVSDEGLAGVMAELLTVRKYGLPVQVVCVESAAPVARIDFQAYAAACGVTSARVDGPEALAAALRWALRSGRAAVTVVGAAGLGELALPTPATAPATATLTPGLASGPAAGVGGTLGETLAGLLAGAGVRRAYGRPAAAIAPLTACLRRAGITFRPVVDPESASMMASADSKWTGAPAVCVAADHADLAVLLNGLYDAALDGNPLVALTAAGVDGQASPLDPAALLGDVAAVSVRLRPDAASLAQAREALQLARGASWRVSGSAGKVVHLAVDWRDLCRPSGASPSTQPWDLHFELDGPGTAARRRPVRERDRDRKRDRDGLLPAPALLDTAAERLSRARRAAILVGRGAAGSGPQVEALARRLHLPVVTTMPGRGVLSDDHPHLVGAAGSSGHRSAHRTLERCDTLLALGVSTRGGAFDIPGGAFLIQVDRDPLQLCRRTHRGVGLYGTVAETLDELLARLAPPTVVSPGRSRGGGREASRRRFLRARQASFGRWRRRTRRTGRVPRAGRPIPPSFLCRTLREVLAGLGDEGEAMGRPVVTVDVGLTTLWVYRYLPGQVDFVWTSSFAAMGFAMPAALAIAPLAPGRPVLALVGDGGIGITMAELAAAHAPAPVVVVVFNNGKLAAIKYEQEVMGWPEHESELCNGDFASYARACGVNGVRVTNPEQLAPALRAALAGRTTCLLDVVCDPHETPWPARPGLRQAAGFLLARVREARASIRHWRRA